MTSLGSRGGSRAGRAAEGRQSREQHVHTGGPSATPAAQPTTFAVKYSIQVIYTYASVNFRGRGILLPVLSNIPVCR